MTAWIPLQGGFIEADVIRWEEAVFGRPGRRTKRPMKIGARRVTAEVLKGPDSDGWVALLVRQCEVLSETVIGQVVEAFKNGKEIRRSEKTILRGKPERLPWSDESARDIVASRFLSDRPTPKPRRTTTRARKPRNSTSYRTGKSRTRR